MTGDFTYNSTANQTLSCTLSGAGAMTRDGTGTLMFSGNTTYAVSTTINACTLLVSADEAIKSKDIALSASGLGLRFSVIYIGTVGLLTFGANSTLDLGTGSLIGRFSDIDFLGYNLSIFNWTSETLWAGTNWNNTDQVYIMAPFQPADLDRITLHSGDYGSDSFLGAGILRVLGGSVLLWRKRRNLTADFTEQG